MKKYHILAAALLFFTLAAVLYGQSSRADAGKGHGFFFIGTGQCKSACENNRVTIQIYPPISVYGQAPGGWSEIRFQNRKAYVPSSQLKTAKSTIVVTFGDSNTQGTNWKQNPSYPQAAKWATKLGQIYTVVNSGIGGDTSVMGRDRFGQDVLNKRPDVVTIMFGTNDAVIQSNGQARVSKAKFEQNIRYFTDTLKAKKIRVVLMTTPPVVQGLFYNRYDEKLYKKYSGARQWNDSYNAIIRKVAKEEKVTLIDNYQNMNLAAGGATDQKLILSGLIDSSGTHLTPRGADMIYQSVNRVLSR